MIFQRENLADQYAAVRQESVQICAPLKTEDYVVQPMIDASPPKWHLAHVSWFFETFLLKPYVPNYTTFDDAFEFLFNSYYNGVGAQFQRSERGRLSRPTVSEVMEYRHHVDSNMATLLGQEMSSDVWFRTVLGLNHEQQHQELMYTDLKYNLGNNPLFPAYRKAGAPLGFKSPSHSLARPNPSGFIEIPGGLYEIGHQGDSRDFAFDNESPRHQVYVDDFLIANRLVTNGEYLEFINQDGYQRPELWLSDAWTIINQDMNEIRAPLYWFFRDNAWYEYSFDGLAPLDLGAPVCHVSGYEADAYARFRGGRLPTEAEWETMSAEIPVEGNFVESEALKPMAPRTTDAVCQVFGDVWEWTQSSYQPYPGFKEFDGALGEYNGKFMANQLVLRGGSCVTPESHMRRTYRNFFYPKDRWQFSGIRLAKTPSRTAQAV